MPEKFVKRPVEVEAMQWTGNNIEELKEWASDVWFDSGSQALQLWINASNVAVFLEIGEWVIQDKHGFYPCKADVFAKTYGQPSENDADDLKITTPGFHVYMFNEIRADFETWLADRHLQIFEVPKGASFPESPVWAIGPDPDRSWLGKDTETTWQE